MGDDNSSSGIAQTLASVLAGGLAGYVDSQNQQPVYVQQPAQQTAYGYTGTTQLTPAGSVLGLSPTMLLLVGGLVVVVLMLKK